MSNKNEEDFCANATDMEEYDEFDYLILFRALDSVRVTSKELLEKENNGGASETFRKNSYVKCKRNFSFYTCKVKPEIQQTKERKKLMTTLFSVIIFLGTSYYTYWLAKQLWYGLSGKTHSVPIFYACMYIVLFNPIFSLITVSVNIVKFRSKSYMDKEKKESIENIEDKIKTALSCFDSFTNDNICAYYKFFDDDNVPGKGESLCSSLDCTECDTRVDNSPLNKDVIASKIEKLNSVNKFFVNQKKYILKANNPMIEIKHNVYIDNSIQFLLGKNVKTQISENIQNSDDTLVFLTNVNDIRKNVDKIIQLSEGYRYDEIGKISNYEEYFEVALSQEINDIILEIIKFFKSYDNVETYWNNNEHISEEYKNISNLVVYADNYNPNTQTYETMNEKNSRPDINEGDAEKIIQLFYSIIVKLRRLNIAWLPEYIHLKNLLFELTDPQIEETTQRALYKVKNENDLQPSFKRILAIFINNPTFFEISSTSEKLNVLDSQYTNLANQHSELVVIKSDASQFQFSTISEYVNPFVPTIEGSAEAEQIRELDESNPVMNTSVVRHFRNVFKLSVASITGDKYVWFKNMSKDEYGGDSLIFKKCETFIFSLKHKALPLDYMQKFKVECMLIKNVLLEYLDNITIPNNKIIRYIDTYIQKHNPIPGDTSKILIFKGNVKKLFDYTMKKKAQEQKNADIYYDTNNEIEFPNKYITFEEFNIKIMNIEKGQFMKYSSNVAEVGKDITYFIDKIEELNNNIERKQAMSKFYLQYAYIYIIASFFYLLNLCYETYFDDQIDFAFIKQQSKLSSKKPNESDPKPSNTTNPTTSTPTGGDGDEITSREALEKDLMTEEKYEKTVKIALFCSMWMLSCVLIFTYNNKNQTIIGYNRIMTNINTKKLETQMLNLYTKVSEYSEKQFSSDSMDSSVEDKGDSQSGIMKTKKDFFIQLIKAIELYDKCNYIQQNAQNTPFPWTEVLISGIILLIMLTLIVVSNFQNNPFKKLNIEEDKYSLLKLVEDTMKIKKTIQGGAKQIVDTSVDNELQQQLEKLNGLETMMATRISFFKADSTFNYVSVSFCIFVFSFYLGYKMLLSNINFKNNLYSGSLYIKSKCY